MAERTTGTVTFLFTDIEGSTRLAKALGERYGEVLAEHRRLLRLAFRAQRGREIDVQGDSMFVAFERARDAVVAAAAAQAALAQRQWVEGHRVRVRIGIHTGEAFLGEKGYVGVAVHRAARICAVGHGGQILLSASTAAVVADDVLEGLTLHDLGPHRLKDIERVERIHEVIVEGAVRDAEPMQELEAQAAGAASARRTERIRNIGGLRHAVSTRARTWSRFASLLWEAVWESSRSWINAALVVAIAIAAVTVSVWFSIAGAVVVAVRVGASMRGVRFFHTSEGVGWKVYSIAHLAPDERLRADFLALGGAFVRTGRVAHEGRQLLAASNRRRSAHSLSELRKGVASRAGDLERADFLARKLRRVDRLAASLRALEEETRRVETRLPGWRERAFDARLDPALREELADDVERSSELVSKCGTAVALATAEARVYRATAATPSTGTRARRAARIG